MVKDIKKAGFTLIELLSVIVIIGIVLGITIPSVISLMNKQNNKKYEYHEKIVKQATDAYVDQFSKTFGEEQGVCSCYKIPYKNLIEEDLIKEEDITCDVEQDNETKGLILAYPLGDGNLNFRYEYYLTCKDKKSGKIVHDSGPAVSDCCGVNGNFFITNAVVKYNDKNGSNYPQTDDNWTNQNVYQEFEANDPYMAGIKGYEYSLNGGLTWNFVDKNSWTFTTDMNKTVQVRAVDNDGNRSTVRSYQVRIDKTNPRADFDIRGTLGENNWYTSDITIGVKNQTDGSGSGVASASVNITQITSNTSPVGQKVTLTVKDKVGNIATIDRYIKVDKTVPTVGNIILNGTLGTNGWYISDVKVSATGGSAGPSGFTNQLSHTIINYDTKSVTITLTTKAGNGLSKSTTKTIKVDKSAPSIPTSNGIGNGNISSGGGSLDNVSGVVQYLYCKRTDNITPTNNDGCFSSNSNFGSSCGQTWRGYVVAVNGAGLRSPVKSHGSYYTGDCCTLPPLGSSCSYEGQTTTCGQTYYCRRRVTRHEAWWYLYSGSEGNWGGVRDGGGQCVNNGDRWNLGGDFNGSGTVSYWASISGDQLYQYRINYVIPNYSYMCHYIHETVLEWQNW